VQLTNVSSNPISVNCWYINGNRVCDNAPGTVCQSNSDCPLPGICQAPTCVANDFHLNLTPSQPIAWRVSAPPSFLPCDSVNPDPNALAFCLGSNDGSAIPLTPDPFVGELKCVEVDASDRPIPTNDLKGEATIYRVSADPNAPLADSSAYNAIGIQAGTSNDGDNVLELNGTEYAGCPGVLILDHFFEGATSPINAADVVRTNLTLVPCTESLLGTPVAPVTTAAQMLIYNEFEQRFSTSRRVSCFSSGLLADIDTRASADDDAYSVFSVGTQGTITGQTRIRGVETTETALGHGLLGVAEEFHIGGGAIGAAAFNLNYFGDREQVDFVTLSLP